MSAEIGVSKTAVYDKLNRLEPNVSQPKSFYFNSPENRRRKSPFPPYDPRHPHVSTARLLAQKKQSRACLTNESASELISRINLSFIWLPQEGSRNLLSKKQVVRDSLSRTTCFFQPFPREKTWSKLVSQRPPAPTKQGDFDTLTLTIGAVGGRGMGGF